MQVHYRRNLERVRNASSGGVREPKKVEPPLGAGRHISPVGRQGRGCRPCQVRIFDAESVPSTGTGRPGRGSRRLLVLPASGGCPFGSLRLLGTGMRFFVLPGCGVSTSGPGPLGTGMTRNPVRNVVSWRLCLYASIILKNRRCACSPVLQDRTHGLSCPHLSMPVRWRW